MSVRVTTWVWHDRRTSELRGNQMLAMLALADIANDHGEVVFTRPREGDQVALARKARMSVATFRRVTQDLEAAGLLEVTRETQRSENAYRLILSAHVERSEEVTAQSERSLVSGHTPLIDMSSSIAPSGAKKGSRIDPEWRPAEALLAWTSEHAPSVDVVAEAENFVDYWLGVPGARGVKLDWPATWRTWMRRAHQRNVDRGWKGTAAAVQLPPVPFEIRQRLAARHIPVEEWLEERDNPEWVRHNLGVVNG